MKKVLISILLLILTTGCVSINDASLEELIDTTLNSKYKLYNHVNRGYKYYLPRELKTTKQDEYNEIIKSKYYDYYLYIDLVSYYNKVKYNYKENNELYYSKLLKKDDFFGILNITHLENDEYLVNVTYNYASIEVKVKEKDINAVVTDALVILSTIEYNDDVIKNLLDENILSSVEENVQVFDKETDETDYLEVEDIYTGNEEEDYDPDVIN